MPCLLIWGNQDTLILQHYSDGFKKDFNNMEFETVEDEGHAPYVETTALDMRNCVHS